MDLHTLHLEHTILLVLFALLTAINARLQRYLPGVRMFVLYNMLALLGSLGVTMRSSLPGLLSITVGNILVIGAYVALFESIRELFGLPRRLLVIPHLVLLAGIVTMFLWGTWHPNTPARLIAYSVCLGAEQVALACVLLTSKREVRQLSWILSGLLLALATANVFRVATVVVRGAPRDYLQSGPTLAAIILVNTCLQCGLLLSYVWMTAALLRKDLEVSATTDPLTGLMNRRALDAAAERAIRAIDAGKGVFAAVLLDLDKYKPLNDRLGHAAGDQALQIVSQCLQREMRSTDMVARRGGDEFVLLLPRTAAKEASEIAERLRGCIEELDLELPDPEAEVTGSFGVAEAIPGQTWEELLARCDGALYAAKHNGGNAVVAHEADPLALQRSLEAVLANPEA